MRTICFLVTEDWCYISHRLDFSKKLIDAGFDVVVGCRFSGQEDIIREAGIRVVEIPFTRGSVSILKVFSDILHVRRFLCKERPDIVHAVSLRPVLIGALASLGLKFATVNTINGLGSLFSGSLTGWRFIAIGHLVKFMLRIIFRRPKTFNVFQNMEDMNSFIESKLTLKNKTFLIRGAGIDCTNWHHVPEPTDQPPVIIFVGRLIKDKGVCELLEASQILKERGCAHILRFAGTLDPCNPSSLTSIDISAYAANRQIEWLGNRNDILELMSHSNIVVLPSYREGLPKVLLEAGLACRAVVTTDVVGCREIIEHEKNGLLVPARDPQALALALERLLASPGLRRKFAEAHHDIVRNEYSLEYVTRSFIQLYNAIAHDSANSL